MSFDNLLSITENEAVRLKREFPSSDFGVDTTANIHNARIVIVTLITMLTFTCTTCSYMYTICTYTCTSTGLPLLVNVSCSSAASS